MARPEQSPETRHAECHQGRHGGDIVEGGQRHEGGAFAEGNTISKERERQTMGKVLHKAFRDQIGEENIRWIATQLLDIAQDPTLDPKDRMKAMELILDRCLPPKSQTEIGMQAEADGTTKIAIRITDAQGVEHDL